MASFNLVLVFVVVFHALILTMCSDGAKIVSFSMLGGSQYLGMRKIALELAARGHEVTILVSSIQKTKPTTGIAHAVYKVPVEENFMENLVTQSMKNGLMYMFSEKGMFGSQKLFCECALNSSDILEPLKKFDLVLADNSRLCGVVLAEYLNVPRVDYSPVAPRSPVIYQAHGPSFPSYVPLILSRNPARMNFLQRLKNTLVFVVEQMMTRFLIFPLFDDIKQRYNINPEMSYGESFGNAEMTLFLADHALDYAFPLLPGHKLIGGINIEPARPLSPEFQHIVNKSDGVIVVSFGSNFAAIADKEVDVLARAFGRLKETVIWRQKGYIPANLSPNIKTVEWLPQNDLLANEKTRVFVSHLGQNSLYEAGYHGIPLVGVPLFGDQPDNAVLVEDKGLGLAVDIHTVTADKLYRTIRRVIDEPRFKENAVRISRLMQDRRRSPTEEAADWIEYTLRHGRLTHLRPASIHLTWYQYFLLDVMLFMGVVLLSVAMVIRLVLKLVCSCFCRKRTKTKTQ